MVGAVLVREDRVVGEGFHRRAGGPHAEILALRAAGAAARGSTMFVTLEPCAHEGRTGPCANAIVEAGVARVVVAHRDPFAAVAGRGIQRLREAGIEVSLGDGAPQSRALNTRWLRARDERRPFVALKFAATVDGKTASRDADSRWITGERARQAAHRLRQAYDAVAVGAGTVRADDPRLNARGVRGRRQPLRVVVDGRLRTNPSARVHDDAAPGGSLVLASRRATLARQRRFQGAGVAVEVIDELEPSGRQLLAALAARGVTSVLVEGGGELAWSLVADGVVDHVYAFIGPLLLGGRTAPSAVGGEGFARLSAGLGLEVVNLRRLGVDVLLEAVAV
jgi:diaminohydroxyphosphoribosylaminopyrimidine deaminase/5-amino-6-(5-phosphoribosylamino)uracil reductase